MIARLKAGKTIDDSTFNTIYPKAMRSIAEFHFTPIAVIKEAIPFLVAKADTKVLDIGAGAGKFCHIGACLSNGHFTGVEIRKELFLTAQKISKQYQLLNTHFIHANITVIDFQPFDAFYFFNAFFENRFPTDVIDHTISLDQQLYFDYSFYVKHQLNQKPVGTKLVTYFSYGEEVPTSYQIQKTAFGRKVKFWQKVI